MSPVKELTLTINEDSIEGVPEEIWEKFKERTKINFPNRGDDAWAFFISEVILAVGGGTNEVASYFMTDVPLKNAKALEDIFAQANLKWDLFHAYLLTVAVRDKHLRIINFTGEDRQEFGTFIATGIPMKALAQIEQVSGASVEDFMAALFLAASEGTITLTGNMPTRDAHL
jgi:hypothetical protein